MSAPTLGSFDDKLTQCTVRAIDLVKLKIIELGLSLYSSLLVKSFLLFIIIVWLFFVTTKIKNDRMIRKNYWMLRNKPQRLFSLSNLQLQVYNFVVK